MDLAIQIFIIAGGFVIIQSGVLYVLFSGKMSFNRSNMSSGSRMNQTVEFGRTHVVRPQGRHQATIVWVHDLGEDGSRWSQLLETLPLRNIKWICPTAPTRPVASYGGFSCTAWFDVGEISEDAPDDREGLDAAATHVANLLSTEPADVKLGVGGFSMGAAVALHSGTCHVVGKYLNGMRYPVHLKALVGVSGWLPCLRTLRSRIEGSQEALRRAASLPTLLCHGSVDDVVTLKHGELSARTLSATGFKSLTFRTYDGFGHFTIPQELNEICYWLTAILALEGS